VLTVNLMIFFELKAPPSQPHIDPIELMLNMTHDPIGDFINAVSADVVNYASSKTYEDLFVDTTVLSELTTYPQLCSRASRIGYHISKVRNSADPSLCVGSSALVRARACPCSRAACACTCTWMWMWSRTLRDGVTLFP
jgi:hypothetical protein